MIPQDPFHPAPDPSPDAPEPAAPNQRDQTGPDPQHVAHSSSPPPRARRSYRSSEDLPRLLLWWCFWLLGSWLVIRKVHGFHLRELPFGLLSPASPPSARWMLYASLLGLMLMWPAYRLTQKRARIVAASPLQRAGQILLDWFGLCLLLQLVLWPLYQMGGWSLTQTAWIDGAVLGWSLLTALLLAWGLLPGPGPRRTLAMALCAALLFAEPALMGMLNAVGLPVHWHMWVSPLATLAGLSVKKVDFTFAPWAWHVIAACAAASLAWTILLLALVCLRPQQNRSI